MSAVEVSENSDKWLSYLHSATLISALCPIATTLPLVGLGTYRAFKEDCYTSCFNALQQGYRHIDTAAVYRNEEYVGRAVAHFLLNDQKVSRVDLHITSKLAPKDMKSEERAYAAGLESLHRLKTAYVDLFLIHWPGASGVSISDPRNADYRLASWRALERLYDEGKCRMIGVSNFTEYHLTELIKHCRIKPAVNQVEFHPLLTQKSLLNYCISHSIQLQAYSSIAQGNPELLQHDLVNKIATTKRKTHAQVLLRWAVQHGVGVIPKSIQPSRTAENADIFDFCLSTEDMKQLDSLNQDKHFCWNPTDVV